MFHTPTKQKRTSSESYYDTMPTKKTRSSTMESVLTNGQTITLHCMNPCPATMSHIQGAKLRQRGQSSSKKSLFYTMKAIPSVQNQSYQQNAGQDSDDREYLTLPNNNVVKLFRFVITASGQLICGSNDPNEHLSHGAMVDDSPVFAAGEFGMDEKGKLCYVSNRTGHYRIPPTTLTLVYSYLIDVEGYQYDDIQKIHQGTYTIGENDSMIFSIQEIGDSFVHEPSVFKDYPIQSSEHSTANENKDTSSNCCLNINCSIFNPPPSPQRNNMFNSHTRS